MYNLVLTAGIHSTRVSVEDQSCLEDRSWVFQKDGQEVVKLVSLKLSMMRSLQRVSHIHAVCPFIQFLDLWPHLSVSKFAGLLQTSTQATFYEYDCSLYNDNSNWQPGLGKKRWCWRFVTDCFATIFQTVHNDYHWSLQFHRRFCDLNSFRTSARFNCPLLGSWCWTDTWYSQRSLTSSNLPPYTGSTGFKVEGCVVDWWRLTSDIYYYFCCAQLVTMMGWGLCGRLMEFNQSYIYYFCCPQLVTMTGTTASRRLDAYSRSVIHSIVGEHFADGRINEGLLRMVYEIE